MVVQHNLTAMNSNRMLGITTGTQAKSTEKLSSGYKINRAADDAAGLSISEKMRKQIRGLTQASLNAEDGISAVQTAEGALNEVQDMLQRMNELAVKAANGTMSEDDRNYIQDEIDQLVTEIDRVAETTKFNETYLLKGVAGKETQTVGGSAAVSFKTGKEYKESYAMKTNSTVTFYAVDASGAQVALDKTTSASDFAKYVKADGSAQDGYVIYKTTQDTTGQFGVQVTGDRASANDVATEMAVKKEGVMTGTGAAISEDALKTYFDAVTGAYKGGLYSAKTTDGLPAEIGAEQINNFVQVDVTAGSSTEVDVTNALEFKLHVGADAEDNNQITVEIDAMDAASLNLKTGTRGGKQTLLVNGATDTNARAAINTIKDAIQQVSTQRSALGAVQNRLEHTIANLDNVVENTTAAESQIRDTDMATEMVKYSNNNILAQAGQAMLAQANQANQGVLSLLG